MWNRKTIATGMLVCLTFCGYQSLSWAETKPAATTPKIPMQAQTVSAIDLNQVFALADMHNPKILAARAAMGQAKANIGIAREIPNPQLQTNYGFGATTYTLGNPQQALLVVTLEMGGKRKARTRLAQSQMTLAEAQLNDLRQDIRSQVRQAYMDLVSAKETAQTLNEQAKLLKDLLEIAKKRHDAGAAPGSDVVQASLSYNQLIPQIASADGRIRQAHIQLNTLVGKTLPPDYEINDQETSSSKDMLRIRVQKTQLAPEVNLPTLDSLLKTAEAKRYDLQAALQQVDVARRQVKLTKTLRIPDIQLGSGYAFLYNRASTPYFNQGAFFTLGVTLPVFHNQQSELKRDQSGVTQAEMQATDLRRQIENDVEMAYAALQTAIVNVHLYEDKLLPEAADLSQLAKMSYEVGKTGLPNVILGQQSAQQVRAGYLDAVISYHRAMADLEKAMGGSLE